MKELLNYIEQNKKRYLDELSELISIPSISANSENKTDIKRCIQWLFDHLVGLGMEKINVFPTDGHPIIYAEWLHASGKPTILLYGHYDVQPVDPIQLWNSPPFEATVRDGNLYARGATDDKGQFFVHFKAIEAYFKNVGELPLNIKMIIEGEEEIGSVNLERFLKEHRNLLKSDVVLISDTSMYAKGVPSICYGLRGLTYMQIDCIGPNRDLHSGTYGGAIHNPIKALSEIIAKLHDEDGRVAIPKFYDDVKPLTNRERKEFRKLPWNDEKFAKELGVKELFGEKRYTTLERLWTRPTLECNGIFGGYTGDGTKTVLPSQASAKISMRIVPDQKPERIAKLFQQYIRQITPKTVRVNVRYLHGGEPVITPIDSLPIQAAVEALKKGFGKKPLYQREGGSIPILAKFKKILGVDSVLLGFGLPDENAHGPNEFLNLENFYGGIRTAVHFYNELPKFMNSNNKRK